MRIRNALFLSLFAFAFACGDSSEDEPIVLLENSANNANSTNNANAANSANSANAANNANSANSLNNIPTGPRTDLEVVFEDQIDVNGTSASFTFDVPDDAISVTINASVGAPNSITLGEWKQGDGSEVITTNWFQSDMGFPQICLACPQRITVAEGAFAAAVPGNQTIDLVPGTHTARIFSFTPSSFGLNPYTGNADVWVVVQRAAPEPQTGVLDLNLWFTGAGGLTAQTAPNDEEFQKMLDDVNTLYARMGIRLGRLRYYDAPQEFQVVENVDPGGDLTDLFKVSAGAEDAAVNVFFVEELISVQLGAFGVILGVAGNIPGPTQRNGTDRSGVALALKRVPQLTTPLYKVFGHEVGHFLGLYHTSEQDFGFGTRIHDQLDDTPQDDKSMLMHNEGTGDGLSESQGRVVRHNPWVRVPAGGQQ